MLGDKTKGLQSLKKAMVERYNSTFNGEVKKKRTLQLKDDPSVEIIFLNPEEIDEELKLLMEMEAKDDAVFTVKACIDKNNMGEVAEEIIVTCEIENIPVEERDGKLYVVGAIMFAFYTSPQVLHKLGNGNAPGGEWVYELFFPHSVKRAK